MRLTVGNLTILLFSIGVLFNQIMYHVERGAMNPFDNTDTWSILTGVIYLCGCLGVAGVIAATLIKHWNKTIKL